MGGTKAQTNKVHKTKFASKSSRNAHKMAGGIKGPARSVARTVSTGQRARDLRLQRNKNIREHKRAAVVAEKRASSGAFSSPLILAIVALSSSVNVEQLKKQLISTISTEEPTGVNGQVGGDIMETEELVPQASRLTTIAVPRYKLRLSVVEAPRDDLQACLEVAKVADIIAFAVSASEDGDYVDKAGKTILSMIRAAGFPTATGLIVGLADVSMKRRADAKKAAIAALQTQLPEDSKCFLTDGADDFHQIMRHLADQRPSIPQWRSERPYVVAHELELSPVTEDTVTLLLSGYVRGRGLSVNQLVHVAGAGDFQLTQIDILEDPCPLRQHRKILVITKEDSMTIEEKLVDQKILLPDAAIQEPLVVENTPDSLAGEQTWPTEEELSKAGQENRKRLKKRVLPKGTSDYQAAWIVDDSDQENEDESDDPDEGSIRTVRLNENEDEGSMVSEDDEMRNEMPSQSESVWDDEDDGRSEMMDDEELSPAERAEEIKRLRAAHTTDEEFPDEIDTPTDKLARERFAKYRGLKSFRTSPWDPKESLPSEYSRIFAFDNFVRTQKHVLSKATEVDHEEVTTNKYVKLYIKDVPLKVASTVLTAFQRLPVVACGLLQHESKMSVLHFSIRKHDGYSEPIKSKETLIFHTGFRHYNTRPIFSTDDMNMDKHKFERFLHPGQFAMASVFAPISFPTLPLIVFKECADGIKFVASGSLRSADPNQIILKRIVLSGFPQKVSKRTAVVRFLFHNPQDVRWFRPVELWTKYGRRGRIKEPVGTHGSMKCVFDGVVQQRDAVCLSLYKRVYPKWPLQ